jgi:hypothetical protein
LSREEAPTGIERVYTILQLGAIETGTELLDLRSERGAVGAVLRAGDVAHMRLPACQARLELSRTCRRWCLSAAAIFARRNFRPRLRFPGLSLCGSRLLGDHYLQPCDRVADRRP